MNHSRNSLLLFLVALTLGNVQPTSRHVDEEEGSDDDDDDDDDGMYSSGVPTDPDTDTRTEDYWKEINSTSVPSEANTDSGTTHSEDTETSKVTPSELSSDDTTTKSGQAEPPMPMPTANEESKNDFICPPKVASRVEEVVTICRGNQKLGYSISGELYTCINDKDMTPVCDGVIDETKEIPTCPTFVINSCSKTDIYANVPDGVGPCNHVDVGMFRNSAYCNEYEETFACFDRDSGEWCRGSVAGAQNHAAASNIPADLEYKCPPPVVSTFGEVFYFCSNTQGLNSSSVVDEYHCEWNGVRLCEGRIDPRISQMCSSPVRSCDEADMLEVCDIRSIHTPFTTCFESDTPTIYAEQKMTFECFDKTLDQYCIGVVGRQSTAVPLPEDLASPETSVSTKSKSQPKEQVQSDWDSSSSFNFSALLIVLSITAFVVLAVMLALRSRRRTNRKFYQKVVTSKNSEYDLEMTNIL